MTTWSTPPTFSDGNALSASQLNGLVDNINFLKGAVDTPAIIIPALHLEGTTAGTYMIKHKHRYLWQRAQVTTDDCTQYDVEYNELDGTNHNVFSDHSTRTAPYIYDTVIDLWGGAGSAPSWLVVGRWYKLDVQVEVPSAAIHLYYYLELPNAS